MVTAVYGTDLSAIDDAQAVASYAATGGGAGGLADETDYFINGTQCISKAGFTATQKGIIHDDVSAPSITAGDAVFIWGRQANRNILDTIANSGGAVIMGTSNSVFAGFNVDGSNAPGSELLSWVSYAVDPTQTSSYSSGTPGAASTWDHFGMEWKILGSGSLKGNPNAVGASWHGRELQVTEGFTVADGTFAGAASTDTTNRWGILIEVAGGYQFHGAFVMGTTGTAVNFIDSNRAILVLDDPFLPAGFNEFEIRNASSNVEWTNIVISHLGTNTPSILKLDVGTFIGETCQFNDFDTTTFSSTGICLNTVWTGCKAVDVQGADISGSSILVPSVAANNSGLIWDISQDTDGSLDNMTFSKTSGTAHHAIEFGTTIPTAASYTIRGCDFGTDFSATEGGTTGDETFHFLDTTGTITLNLVGCTGNFGYRTEGVTVTIVADPVATTINVFDTETPPVAISGARVFLEASDGTGPLPYQESVSIVQTAGVATVTHTAHGIPTGTNVVIRGATQNEYNKVAVITVTGVNTYTYAVDSGAVSPATGSPVASGVLIQGTTNGSGVITDSRTLSGDQPFTGVVRKSSAAPYYQSQRVNGITDSVDGFSTTVSLLLD